ncbi:hypothetical protein [Xanthomonas phaseoli]|uniref:hypothetical protein n=1 Tax=Xanthomonas phaseoli TaxID=1985254 RepID=UPI001E33050D|nr:hypothetical protein [Xanthomonas phaseoli]MCC8468823.1 hypothetical protein [Xanthomonas phaseoli]
MTHHFILTGSLVLIACAYLRGLLGYLRYAKQCRFDLVDSQYRAASLVANAKRSVSRPTADAPAGRRPMQTGCGAHGPALFRSIALEDVAL